MKISNTVGYALAAVAQLALHGGATPLSCHQICIQTGMPERYMLQILRSLVRAEIATSTRGVQGGYRLAKPPKQITLLAVIDAVDRMPLFEAPDFTGLNASSLQAIDKAVSDITVSAQRRLAEFTLDNLKLSK